MFNVAVRTVQRECTEYCFKYAVPATCARGRTLHAVPERAVGDQLLRSAHPLNSRTGHAGTADMDEVILVESATRQRRQGVPLVHISSSTAIFDRILASPSYHTSTT
jgi:hypothetical protein